ncbi:hypothetical protein BV133_2079 [Blastochloris viridis]|uniref:Uncharacterized protein n=1 Tax=Blastochloris viridis TaxID=1079 RepID=A0A182D4J1_BLAVI|nr:hypothetical protein BV133_2079 [Blastochloris viridis]
MVVAAPHSRGDSGSGRASSRTRGCRTGRSVTGVVTWVVGGWGGFTRKRQRAVWHRSIPLRH